MLPAFGGTSKVRGEELLNVIRDLIDTSGLQFKVINTDAGQYMLYLVEKDNV